MAELGDGSWLPEAVEEMSELSLAEARWHSNSNSSDSEELLECHNNFMLANIKQKNGKFSYCRILRRSQSET